jgi:uncharacterized membrane protein
MFQATLILATLLCALVAGFLFAFAAVVMPGIRNLDDGAFIRTFQAIDRIIQNSQPLFIGVWVGSVLTLLVATVVGVRAVNGLERTMLVGAAALYLLCVQLPTITVNVPLNNALQEVNPDAMNEAARQRARYEFEARWNRWNMFRTACAILTSLLLMLLLARV